MIEGIVMKKTSILTSLMAITAVVTAGTPGEEKLERRHSFKALKSHRLAQTPEADRLYKKREGELIPHVDMSDIKKEGDSSEALRQAAASRPSGSPHMVESQKIKKSLDALHNGILLGFDEMRLPQKDQLQKMLSDPDKDKYNEEFQDEIQNLLLDALAHQQGQAVDITLPTERAGTPEVIKENLEMAIYGNAVEFWESHDIKQMRQLRNVSITDKNKLIRGFKIAVENKKKIKESVFFAYGTLDDADLDQAKAGITRLQDFGFTVNALRGNFPNANYEISIDGVTAQVRISKAMRR